MWISIIFFIVMVVGAFLWSKFRMEKKIRKQGGLRMKYDAVILGLLERFPKSTIYEIKSSYLSLGESNIMGWILFEFEIGFGNVDITFKMKDSNIGSHNLKWKFFQDEDQKYMLDKILTEIENYCKDKNINEKLYRFF